MSGIPLALTLAVALVTPAAARGWQAPATLAGRVVDARTGVPLAGVRVLLVDPPLDARTGADGRFSLTPVPPGDRTLVVSVVGYGVARRHLSVGAGQTLDLTIPLAAGAGAYTEELTVTAPLYSDPAPGVPVGDVLGAAELQDLRGVLADDPMRAVQVLPGVSTGDDFRAEIAVRGSDFDHLNVTVDGVVAPALIHRVRGVEDTGSVAMVNGDVLDRVALLAGSYPQLYGNRTGAQLDFTLREGSRDRTVARAAVGFATSSATVEGPLGAGRRGSWLVSIRPSYLGWLLHQVDPETTGLFNFIDGQGKLVFDVTDRQQLQLVAVAGRSHLHELGETSPNVVEHGYNRAGLLGVAWRSTIGAGTLLTTRVSLTGDGYDNQSPLHQPLDDVSGRQVTARIELATAIAPSVALEAGGEIRHERRTASLRHYDQPVSGEPPPVARVFDAAATETRPSAFALVRWTSGRGLVVSPGVRVDHSTLIGRTTASPWLQTGVPLGAGISVKAGAGLYQQFPGLEPTRGPNAGEGLKVERARHADLGIEATRGAWRWRVAAYDRAERDGLRLPDSEYRLANGQIVDPDPAAAWVNTLSGSGRGIELLAQRRSPNGLSGWASYAYARTRYTDERTGERYWSDVDQRHTLNLYARYRFSNRLLVSARLRAGSNFPIAGYYQEIDGRYFLAERRNDVRLKRYARVDVRASRTFDLARRRLTLFVEVLNVLNRINVGPSDGSLRRSTGEVRGLTEELFPLLPTAGLLIEF